MNDLTLRKIRAIVALEDLPAARQLLRNATEAGQVPPREAVELLLAMHEGRADAVIGAINAMRAGNSGGYRFIPAADHAAA